MVSIFRRLLAVLDARERRQFRILLVMILVMGLIDMAGVASILPFLAVLSNPGILTSNAVLAAVLGWTGIGSTHTFLVFLGGVTLLFVVFGQLFKALTIYALTRFAYMREYAIGSRLLAGYLNQPYAWFLNRHSADLGKAVLSEVDKVVQGVIVPAMHLLANGAVVLFLVSLLIIVNPAAAIAAALCVGGIYGLIATVARGHLKRIGTDRVRANEERYRIAQEAMGGIKDVKLLGLEEGYLGRYRNPAARFARHQAAASTIMLLPRYLLEAVIFGAMLALLLVLLTTAGGRLEHVLPVVGVYAFAGARLFPALQALYAAVAGLRFHGPALEALHRDLAETRAAATVGAEARQPALPIVPRTRVALRDVRYAYPRADRPVLDGLDLDICANTTVGIVGATGAGKTTVVDVLLGLLQPQSGQIIVDDTIIDAGNLRVWQQSLGYVPQHIFLIDDTVAANIALGIPPDAIDMRAVERAARIAELHDFVVRDLPRGYDTTVGERGVRLSGGQRQRIGIARALYRDPAVIVLDEATSALDNRTERAVMDAVHNLAHAKTIVMIAHRLSTVQACDMIFVLEHGRCVAAGEYDELVDGNSTFRRLALVAE